MPGTQNGSWYRVLIPPSTLIRAMANCNPNYATPEGEPCVPPNGDLDCADLPQWGISEVFIVGDDEHQFDPDQDGAACEGVVPRNATPIGDAVADSAPVLLPIVIVIALAALLVTVQRRATTRAERRNNTFALALAILVILLPAAGAAIFSIIGLD